LTQLATLARKVGNFQRISRLLALKPASPTIKIWLPLLLLFLIAFYGPLLFALLATGLIGTITPPQEQTQEQTYDSTEWMITADGIKMIPAQFLPIYQKYGKQYGVPWPILASIHYVESSFSQNLSVSYAGAVGATQFMPCAWIGWDHYRSYCDPKGALLSWVRIDITDPKNIHGGQGIDADHDGKADPNDPDDAIAATARRLSLDKKRTGKDWFARGGPVWKYNPSASYVNRVKKYATLFAQPLYRTVPVVATGKMKDLIQGAISLKGVTQYVFGGNSFPNALDCSSFTQQLYKRYLGVSLPRTTDQQIKVGTPVNRNELKPGDLVFFQNTYRAGVSHVGIYMGNGTFIHNQSTEKDVQISKLSDGYWNAHYLTARRVAKSQ